MQWTDVSGDLAFLRTHWPDIFGYIGVLLVIAANSRATMISLRVLGISANCFNIAYGIFGHVYPPLVLHAILLPLNAVRLYQMLQLIEKVKVASQGNLDMAWLKPFMSKQIVKAGEIIFSKGDAASAMFYTVSGRYRLKEIESDVAPGQVIGELGLVNPATRRTLTFECVEEGELLTISYAQVKQLYFQNPKFGFYFLELIGQRLFGDIRRLEAKIATMPA
jgi:CRP/FNR family transcriptional regulator, cyclic AMP receptor protein